MKTDSKNDIVTSLNAMDEVQMFKVMSYIRKILAKQDNQIKKPSREQAMMEIRLALKETSR